jgi:hypothetical protein
MRERRGEASNVWAVPGLTADRPHAIIGHRSEEGFMARDWTNTEIKQIREERSMGAKIRDLCRKWDMSEGHMGRILAGTARKEAGGPINTGQTLNDRRPDIEKISEMTVEEFNAMVEKGRETVPAKKVFIPELERQLRPKEDWSIEGMRKKLAQLEGQSDDTPTEVAPSGIPLPPDWMENYGGQNERRPNDPNDLLDELMKK